MNRQQDIVSEGGDCVVVEEMLHQAVDVKSQLLQRCAVCCHLQLRLEVLHFWLLQTSVRLRVAIHVNIKIKSNQQTSFTKPVTLYTVLLSYVELHIKRSKS